MNGDKQTFPYVETLSAAGRKSLMPFMQIELSLRGRSKMVSALADSGASVNVLPFSIGQHLGAVWDDQPGPIPLGGNLAESDARGLVLIASIGRLPPVRLVFAWTSSDASPVILGQTNFFAEFDVCFHQARMRFEVGPKIL